MGNIEDNIIFYGNSVAGRILAAIFIYKGELFYGRDIKRSDIGNGSSVFV